MYTFQILLLAPILGEFRPLFKVTKDPTTHPALQDFLQRVAEFNGKGEEFHKKSPFPAFGIGLLHTCTGYTVLVPVVTAHKLTRVYYMHANIASSNNWRRLPGLQ